MFVHYCKELMMVVGWDRAGEGCNCTEVWRVVGVVKLFKELVEGCVGLH